MGDWTTTPRDWSGGEQVIESMMDQHIRDPFTALGSAWVSYASVAFSGFSLGNGTASLLFNRFGKTVDFRATMTFGSTSAAASAYPAFTLPANCAVSAHPLYGFFYDVSASSMYAGVAYIAGASSVAMGVCGTNGLRTSPTTTAPFTWATGDSLIICGRYESV